MIAPPKWPAPLGEDALYGLAGDVVRLIAPASEADPVAILLQFLALFGNLIGHGAHCWVEGTRHFCVLFVVLVGLSSKARKGTSLGRVIQLLDKVDHMWVSNQVHRGNLASGEGLIELVADDPEEGDEGKVDKRVLLVQEEFSTVLKVMNRDANILSGVIRQAWESGDISLVARRKNKLKATGAHTTICAHVTKDEVRRYLTETESANGFGNRFLWAAVRRSKSLPLGGTINQDEQDRIVKELQTCARFAGHVELKRSAAADALWTELYEELMQDSAGMFDALTSRGTAQVLRLSMIYALLSCSQVICPEHVLAAKAVWQYCEDSVRFIFGTALGDPIADDILNALKEAPNGLTRSDIHQLFGGNKSAARLSSALLSLLEKKLVSMERENTGGRPVERWSLVTP